MWHLLKPARHCSELFVCVCVLYSLTMSVKPACKSQHNSNKRLVCVSLEHVELLCNYVKALCMYIRMGEGEREGGGVDSLMTVVDSCGLRAIQWQNYVICGMSRLKEAHCMRSYAL